ncbi:MAG: Rab family GTPase [Bacteroidota bacterium]
MLQKKVCMLGAYAVGKTSLVSRFVKSLFSDKYHTTVGVRIDKKPVELDGETVNIILWDLHGEDEFQRVHASYLRGTAGYMLVVDGTRPDTVQTALNLHARARTVLTDVPALVLLNKRDLVDAWTVSDSDFEALRSAGLELVETSAKTGAGVEAAFQRLTKRMIDG